MTWSSWSDDCLARFLLARVPCRVIAGEFFKISYCIEVYPNIQDYVYTNNFQEMKYPPEYENIVNPKVFKEHLEKHEEYLIRNKNQNKNC